MQGSMDGPHATSQRSAAALPDFLASLTNQRASTAPLGAVRDNPLGDADAFPAHDARPGTAPTLVGPAAEWPFASSPEVEQQMCHRPPPAQLLTGGGALAEELGLGTVTWPAVDEPPTPHPRIFKRPPPRPPQLNNTQLAARAAMVREALPPTNLRLTAPPQRFSSLAHRPVSNSSSFSLTPPRPDHIPAPCGLCWYTVHTTPHTTPYTTPYTTPHTTPQLVLLPHSH